MLLSLLPPGEGWDEGILCAFVPYHYELPANPSLKCCNAPLAVYSPLTRLCISRVPARRPGHFCFGKSNQNHYSTAHVILNYHH
jgi:hypothetical protein